MTDRDGFDRHLHLAGAGIAELQCLDHKRLAKGTADSGADGRWHNQSPGFGSPRHPCTDAGHGNPSPRRDKDLRAVAGWRKTAQGRAGGNDG